MVKIDVVIVVKEFFKLHNSKPKTFCNYTKHQIYAYGGEMRESAVPRVLIDLVVG